MAEEEFRTDIRLFQEIQENTDKQLHEVRKSADELNEKFSR